MTDRAAPPIPRAFVMGHPIAHSRSPLLHGHWLRTLGIPGDYVRRDVPPAEIGRFLARLGDEGFVGGNVTVPNKVETLAHVAGVDAAAEAIGAVNTLWFEGGRLVGGNTDAAGFLAALDDGAPGWDRAGGRHAVVLGAGGAARATVYGLLQRGFTIDLVNRTLETARAVARSSGPRVAAHEWRALPERLPGADLFVNTTSLGLVGGASLDIDLAGLKPSAVVNDLVYAPLVTGLLRRAAARGHRTVEGLGMLLHQAAPGFERWFGVKPAVTAELRALVEADIRGSRPDA